MTLNGGQRRDQRRRLVVSWNRSGDQAPDGAAGDARPVAAYAPEALPERQPGPATLLPTGLGGLTVAAAAILIPTAAAVAVAAAEPILGRPIFVPQGRFAQTLRAAAGCFDPHGMRSLAGWLAQVSLVLATVVALVVRLMRRHRRDDYNGRYRAWGWLAGLFVVTACAGAVPIGRLVGAAVADATGITFGPSGIGWWVAVAAVGYLAVSLWAVLPLHERGATALWLAVALVSWGVAAGCAWTGGDRATVIGQAAWAMGAALAAIAMLAAARSVIREVRGQCGTAAAGRERRKAVRPEPRAEAAATPVEEEPDFTPAAAEGEADGDVAAYVDGSEPENRHLSKAERKRLKKLARMNRVAA